MASKKPAKDSRPPATEYRRYGLLLVPNFSLIALAAVVDPLRLANGVLGRKVYEYVTLGTAVEPVASSVFCPSASAIVRSSCPISR